MFVFSTRLRVVIRRYFYENEFTQNSTTHRTLMYILFWKKNKIGFGFHPFCKREPFFKQPAKLKQYKSDIYSQRIVVYKSGAKVVKIFNKYTPHFKINVTLLLRV